MNDVSAKEQPSRRLPKMAAMALVFWGLSSGSPLDAAPVWMLQNDLPPHIAPQAKLPFDDNQISVLSEDDAILYRAAFAAQEKADWTYADKALAQITDKRLVGHVLADRYLRRQMTPNEATQWFASYSSLPEAETLYDQVKKLKGLPAASIPQPKAVEEWQGSNGFTSSSGFRNVNDNDDPLPKNPIETEINSALRHGDAAKAREILDAGLNRGALSITQSGDLISRIAASFYYQGEIENARKMARRAVDSGVPFGLWIEGLSAWTQRDFGTSAYSFAELADTKGLSSWDRATAAYWAYRAESRLGDKAQAHRWLAEAAKSPQSFYGAMAVRLMGRSPEHSWKLPELSAKSISLLTSQDAGWQALALAQIGRADLAESELRQMLSVESSRDMQMAALALAEEAHMPSLLLQLSSVAVRANGKPFDAALYPLPPWQPSGGFTVDRALIYAIMLHESQFDTEAVSSRGACGLMQIMPSTARRIANDNRVVRVARHTCPDTLLDPSTNMSMGQKFVHILAERPMIGDNLLFLLAAYNGGPGNLAHWLAGADRSDPLLFLESLPVRETRDYVQQVMMHYWMYRSRLSEPDTAAASLARGEWPRYALGDASATKRADAEGLELASLELAKMNGTR
jgi:soluble lytic murein transglycosylase-like protein